MSGGSISGHNSGSVLVLEKTRSRIEDGGGTTSSADWLVDKGGTREGPLQGLSDRLKPLIKTWALEQRLLNGFSKDGPGMFSEEEVQHIRQVGVDFFKSIGMNVSDHVQKGQTFVLEVMEA